MIVFTILRHLIYHIISVVWFILLITIVVPLIVHIITGETWGDILKYTYKFLCK